MRVEVSWWFNPRYEIAKDKSGNKSIANHGEEDWALALLYFSDEEIARHGLLPNGYEGKTYDWITLPPRDHGAKDGEHLIAAYGGAMSDICNADEKGFNKSTTTSAAYYASQLSIDLGEAELIQNIDIRAKMQLVEAISRELGKYSAKALIAPRYSANKGWHDDEEIIKELSGEIAA
jgi:hypothetical protein